MFQYLTEFLLMGKFKGFLIEKDALWNETTINWKKYI